jgi:hypothetical protein
MNLNLEVYVLVHFYRIAMHTITSVPKYKPLAL